MIYFLAKSAVPIFNTFDLNAVFGQKTGKLLLDDQNRLTALEMIAFKGTVFKVVGFRGGHILQVELESYPTPYPLFIDRRFGDILETFPLSQTRVMPSRDVIIKRLIDALGLPYIWGGNVSKGLPVMLDYYPPKKKHNLLHLEKDLWIFRGLDCSGLLFEATEGISPRNTSSLLFYGAPVNIEGKEIEEIIKNLKPLDLVIYIGHVIIVLNQDEVIESRLSRGGVVKTECMSRLKELMQQEKKNPSNDPSLAVHDPHRFLVRRFLS